MLTLNNVHEQFADFFKGKKLRPFAALLSKKLSEGHICLDLKEIVSSKEEFPYRYNTVKEIEDDLAKEPLVSSLPGSQHVFENLQPFILFNSQLYLHRYFTYETIILNRIQTLVKNEVVEYPHRIEFIDKHRDFIKNLFKSEESVENLHEEERVEWQLVATILGVLNNFTIITGGPGTGKTTTVSKILKVLKHVNPDLKIGLAAPTGKAATRLAESLEGNQPTTIHRMLKAIHGSHHFKHNKENPLNYDIVIVDEASMIDVALFAKLLDAIGPETRLILLGDKDQLASVEAGSLFRDICKTQEQMNLISSKKARMINSFIEDKTKMLSENFISESPVHFLSDHIIELKRSRRFSNNQGIGRLSKAIIYNKIEELKSLFKPNADPQILIDMAYDLDVFQTSISAYESYIKEGNTQIALQKFNEFRVLCAVREGEHGIYKINKNIEFILNKKNLIDNRTEFYNNRPIIITKNYYDLGLYNGDIGIIRPDENNALMAWFEDSEKNLHGILPGLISESETVYAMTIHKSQGSEYDKVLIVLPDNESSQLLTRELLYTAVTRAKSQVTILASEKSLLATTNRSVKRASGIKERFNGNTNKDIWVYN